MRALLRSFLHVGLVGLLLGAVLWVLCAAPQGLDVDDLPDLLKTLAQERMRYEELGARSQACLRASAGRQQVTQHVLAQRLTLFEAAACLRDLNTAVPDYHWEMFRSSYPGASDDERHCRQVIALVRDAASDQPGQAALVARLEAQLQAHLAGGTLRLPKPGLVVPFGRYGESWAAPSRADAAGQDFKRAR